MGNLSYADLFYIGVGCIALGAILLFLGRRR